MKTILNSHYIAMLTTACLLVASSAFAQVGSHAALVKVYEKASDAKVGTLVAEAKTRCQASSTVLPDQ